MIATETGLYNFLCHMIDLHVIRSNISISMKKIFQVKVLCSEKNIFLSCRQCITEENLS